MNEKTGLIALSDVLEKISIFKDNHFSLGNSKTSAAAYLFARLREADKKGFEKILIPLPCNKGIGAAIRNRLEKAASEIINY